MIEEVKKLIQSSNAELMISGLNASENTKEVIRWIVEKSRKISDEEVLKNVLYDVDTQLLTNEAVALFVSGDDSKKDLAKEETINLFDTLINKYDNNLNKEASQEIVMPNVSVFEQEEVINPIKKEESTEQLTQNVVPNVDNLVEETVIEPVEQTVSIVEEPSNIAEPIADIPVKETVVEPVEQTVSIVEEPSNIAEPIVDIPVKETVEAPVEQLVMPTVGAPVIDENNIVKPQVEDRFKNAEPVTLDFSSDEQMAEFEKEIARINEQRGPVAAPMSMEEAEAKLDAMSNGEVEPTQKGFQKVLTKTTSKKAGYIQAFLLASLTATIEISTIAYIMLASME